MSYASVMKAKMKAYDKTSYTRDYTSYFELIEYNRTYELCNEHTVGFHSGNVLKFNTYNLKRPFVIGNRDIYMKKKIDRIRAEMEAENEQYVDAEDTLEDGTVIDGTVIDAPATDSEITDTEASALTDTGFIDTTESSYDSDISYDSENADDNFTI